MSDVILWWRDSQGHVTPLIEIRQRPISQPEVMPSHVTGVVEASLPEYYHRKKPLSTPLLLGIGIVALTGLFVGLGINTKRTEAQPLNNIAPVTVAENATAASAKTEANISAQAEAKLITEYLNKSVNGDTSHLTVTLVNGTILKNTATPNTGIAVYEPIIQNAILLSTVSSQTPDIYGKFLNGAWLGVIGPKDTIETPMAVGTVRFDSNNMRFQASGEPTIVASMITSPVNIVNVGIAHETTAFDTTNGAQLLYSDGSPVFVGVSLTNKG